MSRGLAMGGHHSARMLTDVWLTPPEILDALGKFDLDPCAAPEPRPWPTASRHICLPDDGLSAEWSGRVWLNPPYSREAQKWLRRLGDHGTGTALIFARTETAWFVETVWSKASAVLFLHGRLHFHHADGTRAAANAGAPSCLVAYGPGNAEQLRLSGLPGTLVNLTTRREGDRVMSETARHILTLTADEDGECTDIDFRHEGPIDPSCGVYRPCEGCSPWQQKKLSCRDSGGKYDDVIYHGVTHKWIEYEWMTPTGECGLCREGDGSPLEIFDEYGPGIYLVAAEYAGDGRWAMVFLEAISDQYSKVAS